MHFLDYLYETFIWSMFFSVIPSLLFFRHWLYLQEQSQLYAASLDIELSPLEKLFWCLQEVHCLSVIQKNITFQIAWIFKMNMNTLLYKELWILIVNRK